MAQQTSLGNEFIFFVDGTNVLVPTSQSLTVSDPLAPGSGNKVAQFNAGTYIHNAFQFTSGVGADASGLVGDTFADSDTLYFRINSDPANVGKAVTIMLSDKQNGAAGARADQEANPSMTDNEFRLIWPIPAYISDGQWHNLAIPLPPKTWAALEDAKANDPNIDTLAAKWQYSGTWSNGAFGIGPGFGTDPTTDPLWHEFQWDALFKIGPQWDFDAGTVGAGGPIYLDNVYIGTSNTSIASASAAPTAMSGVSFSADGPANTISWGPISDASGYLVYASLSPITDVKAANVVQVARRSFTDGLSVTDRYEIPHPSLAAPAIYYAVTTLSGFGVENFNVAASSGQVVNANLPVAPYIRGLTEAEATLMFDAVNANTIVDAFPADQPIFRVNADHRSAGDGTAVTALPTDADNSAVYKIGFSDIGELFAYGEVTDDAAVFGPEGVTGATTYGFDSSEFGISPYDVRQIAGGDMLIGSPHQDIVRGVKPDYQFRFSGRQDASGNVIPSGGTTWIGFSLDAERGKTVVEKTATGWRFLTLVPLDDIQGMSTTSVPDDAFPIPGATEVRLIPFIISLNDADVFAEGFARQSQIVSSIKPNVTDQWWNTPAQWQTTAMAGRNAAVVANEDGASNAGFSLAQNAPNPVTGKAQIAFTLGRASHGTLEVFNTLGQRVATVADADFAEGRSSVAFDTSGLAAGVYVYRLTAGDYVATRRMTVLR